MLITALCLLASPVIADDADRIVGVWVTGEGQARVEIVREGDVYRGRIVWIDEPFYAEDDPQGRAGKPKVDDNNPDPELRNRPIVGMWLMENFKFDGKKKWKSGRIYDPENGKAYKCNAELESDDVLKIKGYIGFSWLGRTTKWTRYNPADSAGASG